MRSWAIFKDSAQSQLWLLLFEWNIKLMSCYSMRSDRVTNCYSFSTWSRSRSNFSSCRTPIDDCTCKVTRHFLYQSANVKGRFLLNLSSSYLCRLRFVPHLKLIINHLRLTINQPFRCITWPIRKFVTSAYWESSGIDLLPVYLPNSF